MRIRQLMPHERSWLEEVRSRLASGKPIDYPEMMVAMRNTLPTGFTLNQIDPWYLQGAGLTVAGIHALDPNAEELKDLGRVLFKVKEWFIENSHRQEVSAAAGPSRVARRNFTPLAALNALGIVLNTRHTISSSHS